MSPRLRPLAVFLLCSLPATGCNRLGDAHSAADLTGEYARRHQVWVFHGSEPVEVEVADRLRLTADRPTALRFRLELHALNGEKCRLEGLAEHEREGFVYTGPATARLCELRFDPEIDLIVVTDVESRCRANLCSQSGTVDRVVFSRVKSDENRLPAGGPARKQ